MPAVTSVNPSGSVSQDIKGLLLNQKWAVNSFTFSFPADPSFYEAGSAPSGETTSNFEALNATQQNYVRFHALAQFSAVANLTFSVMTETSTSHADLRFAMTDATNTAWGYYPATGGYGGDTWYRNTGGSYDNPVIGNYAAHTFMHEIGHAMGLVHGHDSSNPFGALPTNHDSIEYSVMTYRSYVGGPSSGGLTYGSASAPQTLMQNDIAALQYLYGVNYNTNSGNTVYSWNPSNGQTFVNGVSMGTVAGNKIFLTIWDGNGVDTYDLSAYSSNLSIDLQPGAWSTFNTSATGQRASLGSGNFAAGNVANALLYNGNVQSLIENVIGGSGNDTIVGNVVGNDLKGSAGNDILNGLGGADVLTGGSGADTFRFDASAFDGTVDQIADYSYAANDVIDLSSVVSTSAGNLASYVKIVMSSGSTASLMVDRDGSGSTYGWATIAQISGVTANSTVNLLIGPSSTAMTTQVLGSNTTPAYTTTTYDTQNQYIWANYSATYNSFDQLLSITFNYDDGVHSAIIYDTPNADIFSDYLVTYNASWQITRIIFNYDDGTHTVASYDLANDYGYAEYLATFDSQWNLTRNIFNNDNGTHSVVNYDVQNQYVWAFEIYEYDASWNLISRHGQNDNGTSFGNGYVGNGGENTGYTGGAGETDNSNLLTGLTVGLSSGDEDGSGHDAQELKCELPAWLGDASGNGDIDYANGSWSSVAANGLITQGNDLSGPNLATVSGPGFSIEVDGSNIPTANDSGIVPNPPPSTTLPDWLM